MKNLSFLLFFLLVISCQTRETVPVATASIDIDSQEQNEVAYLSTLKTHLDAVSNRDLTTLAATLSPKGDMHLLLPQSKMITTAEGFLGFHRDWFVEPNWTLDNKIIHSDIGTDMGISVVEALYKEPERDGKPYFNKMNVSYALKKIEGKWYVVKDHACSVEKSTD